MAKRPLPDQSLLLKLLRYDPETGKLYWREREIHLFTDGPKNSALCKMRSWNSRFSGSEALAYVSSQGYLIGDVLNVGHKSHRVIWKMVTGEDPTIIDHINGNRRDNRFCNLRAVTPSDNSRNTSTYKSNSSGAVGVDFIEAVHGQRRAYWRARICVDNRLITIGSFTTKEDAIRARKAAERKFGFHPNHGRAKS